MDFSKAIDIGLPSGIYNTSYRQDMAIARTRVQKRLLAGLLLLMFMLPILGASAYLLNLACSLYITMIAVEGLNILTGYCGQISLAQAAFVGVGAYSSAILCGRFGFPFWISILCAGLVTGGIGLIFGLPALRLKGFYLAISTLAAQFILLWLFVHLRFLTGGTDSLSVPCPKLGSIEFSSVESIYYLSFVVLIIMTFIAKNIARTKTGRAFVAIRDDDLAAEVMGINLFKYKLLSFFIASFFAGVAGSLYSVWLGNIHPENFLLMSSIWYLGMIVVGGMGSAVGPIFGVMFIMILEEILQIVSPAIAESLPFLGGGAGLLSFANLSEMMFGLIILAFLVLEPRGIVHRWEIFKTSYRMWPFSY